MTKHLSPEDTIKDLSKHSQLVYFYFLYFIIIFLKLMRSERALESEKLGSKCVVPHGFVHTGPWAWTASSTLCSTYLPKSIPDISFPSPTW